MDSRLILLPGQKHSFIVFDYQSPNETVQKYLEMAGGILAQRGFLQWGAPPFAFLWKASGVSECAHS